MISLVLATLRGRPARALLSALGTAVGVATIVALLGVTDGLKQTAGGLVRLGAGDIGLFQKNVSDPSASVLPANLTARLKRVPGIADATPIQLLIEALPQDPAAVVFGVEPRGFVAERLIFERGRPAQRPARWPSATGWPGQLQLRPGPRCASRRRPFRVTGVYHSGILFEDQGAIVSLTDAQAITGRPQDATTISVELGAGVRPQACSARSSGATRASRRSGRPRRRRAPAPTACSSARRRW